MNTAEYQQQAARTLIDDSQVVPLTAREHRIVWNAVGLCGEAGEVLKLVNAGTLRQNLIQAAHLIECNYWADNLMIAATSILEAVKKGVFHRHGLAVNFIFIDMQVLLQAAYALAERADKQIWPSILPGEIGDVCWYAAALCSCLDIDMAELLPDPGPLGPVMQANIEKLKLLFPHGWDVEDSKARRDEVPA